MGYVDLEKEVKSNENYRLLPVQTAQQTVKLVDQNFRSFFSLLRKKCIGQYDDEVRVPSYKKRGYCFNVIFTNQNGKALRSIYL